MKKPESISWDEISCIVYRAHAQNRENGVDIRNAHLTGEEMKESIGPDGDCFVAIDLDGNKLAACCSVCYKTLDTWYAKGLYAYATLEAVLPEYSGKHIFSKLAKERLLSITERRCKGVYMYVAEGNRRRIKIAEYEGFSKVAIKRTSYNPHNYYVLVKWLGNKPYSDFYIKMKYFNSWLSLKLKRMLCRK